MVKCSSLSRNSIEEILKLIPTLDKGKLKEGMISFSSIWANVSNESLEDDYKNDEFKEGDENNLLDENFDGNEGKVFVECSDKIIAMNALSVHLKLVLIFTCEVYNIQNFIKFISIY